MDKLMGKLAKTVVGTAIIMATIVSFQPNQSMAEENIATLRGSPINVEEGPARMNKKDVRGLRASRSYPEQPPVIPHSIRGYQINTNTNKCLTCHNRKSIDKSQAVMVSVTHFIDRVGQVRASVSPRRYFCLQCHVQQDDIVPLIKNDFEDIDDVIGSINGSGAKQ